MDRFAQFTRDARERDLDGPLASGVFGQLPAYVQQELWQELGRQCDERNERLRKEPLTTTLTEEGLAGESAVIRPPSRIGRHDALTDIPSATYVEELTGEEVPRHGFIPCPLPDHADGHPSFKVYPQGWHCFGCNKGGSVYDLAGALWGLGTRGDDFTRLHAELLKRFGRQAA